MGKPRPTSVWLAPRECSLPPERRCEWHACSTGWHRAPWPGLNVVIRPVDRYYQVRIEDDAGEPVVADGANFTEWEYKSLELAKLRGSAQATRIALEKGIVKR
jgi:hypothetical protein